MPKAGQLQNSRITRDILLTKVSQQQYSIDKDRVLEEVRKYSHAKGKSTAEL